jgi:hypothetical protein
MHDHVAFVVNSLGLIVFDDRELASWAGIALLLSFTAWAGDPELATQTGVALVALLAGQPGLTPVTGRAARDQQLPAGAGAVAGVIFARDEAVTVQGDEIEIFIVFAGLVCAAHAA